MPFVEPWTADLLTRRLLGRDAAEPVGLPVQTQLLESLAGVAFDVGPAMRWPIARDRGGIDPRVVDLQLLVHVEEDLEHAEQDVVVAIDSRIRGRPQMRTRGNLAEVVRTRRENETKRTIGGRGIDQRRAVLVEPFVERERGPLGRHVAGGGPLVPRSLVHDSQVHPWKRDAAAGIARLRPGIALGRLWMPEVNPPESLGLEGASGRTRAGHGGLLVFPSRRGRADDAPRARDRRTGRRAPREHPRAAHRSCPRPRAAGPPA